MAHGNLGSKLNSSNGVGSRPDGRVSFRVGGEMSSIPDAGFEEMYVCAIRHPADRAKMIGGNGIMDNVTWAASTVINS